MEKNLKKEEKNYKEFLVQEYLSQKKDFDTYSNQNKLTLAIISAVSTTLINKIITIGFIESLLIIVTILLILIIFLSQYNSQNIESINSYNIETLEATIKNNREEYNKKNKELLCYIKIYFLIVGILFFYNLISQI